MKTAEWNNISWVWYELKTKRKNALTLRYCLQLILVIYRSRELSEEAILSWPWIKTWVDSIHVARYLLNLAVCGQICDLWFLWNYPSLQTELSLDGGDGHSQGLLTLLGQMPDFSKFDLKTTKKESYKRSLNVSWKNVKILRNI